MRKSSFGSMPKEARVALGDRIREITKGFPSQEAAAKVGEFSVDQLARVMSGLHAPALLPIARIARHAGFALDWVAWGAEERQLAKPAARWVPDALDEHDAPIFAQLRDGIDQACEETRAPLSQNERQVLVGAAMADVLNVRPPLSREQSEVVVAAILQAVRLALRWSGDRGPGR